MINRRVVLRRLGKIKENLKVLRRISQLPFESFSADIEKRYVAERALEISIQALIDVCAHLVKQAQVSIPDENHDFPLILGRLGVFPQDLAERLAGMIGMRNVLVHEYLDIDLSLVYQALKENLGDFDEFARYIVEYLEKEGIA